MATAGSLSLPAPRSAFQDSTAETGLTGASRHRAVWHSAESLILLEVVRTGNFVSKICDKNAKKSHLFEELSAQLGENNIFRNGKQVECHWKHLRRTYFQLKHKVDTDEVSEEATILKWEPYIYIKSIFNSASDPEFLLDQGNIELTLSEANDDSYIKYERESVGGSPSDPFGTLQDYESHESEAEIFPSTASKSSAKERDTYKSQIPIVGLSVGAQPQQSQDQTSKRESSRRIITSVPDDLSSQGSHGQRQPKKRRLNYSTDESEINYGGGKDEDANPSEENPDKWSSNMVRYEKALMERQEKFIQYMEKVREDDTKREDKKTEELRDWQMKLMDRQLQHQKEMVQSVMSTFVEIAKIFASKPS